MSTLEIPQIDLECGSQNSANAGSATSEEEEDGSVYFSDGEDGSRRSASPVEDDPCDCSVDIESGEKELHLERDCRICHMSLVSNFPDSELAIELGCSCKDDLAAAHKHCAETWFKIKGNKTCEICNSIARNVVWPNDSGSESNVVASNNTTASSLTGSGRSSWLNGHRFLNFLLACMAFAFVISWLFHFNIPS